jgi:hypothetical protein
VNGYVLGIAIDWRVYLEDRESLHALWLACFWKGLLASSHEQNVLVLHIHNRHFGNDTNLVIPGSSYEGAELRMTVCALHAVVLLRWHMHDHGFQNALLEGYETWR